jgi:hypothetical protein
MYSPLKRLFQRRAPDMRQLDSPLVVIHIPKTAGTAFVNYLAANMPSPHSVAPAIIKHYDEVEWHNPRFKLFYGHLPLREAKPRLPKGIFLTFLREPIARLRSLYRNWSDPRKFPEDDPWRAVMTPEEIADIEFVQRSSIEDFALTERPNLVAALRDYQTMMLSDLHEDSSDRFLNSAKRNLEREIAFFGVTERFAESIELFRSTFRNASEYSLPATMENRSEKSDAGLSQRALPRLEELNSNDLALYEHGLAIFQERIRRMGS